MAAEQDVRKGDRVVLIYESGDAIEYDCRAAAVDGTFLVLDEGPGLSRIVHYDGGGATWRADGYPVHVMRKELD